MERLPQQRYTREFKEEAVRMVLAEGVSKAEAARRLHIPKQTLRYWLNKKQDTGKVNIRPGGYASGNRLEAENARLRHELAEAKMERDILKKATAYFAKESQRGTRS